MAPGVLLLAHLTHLASCVCVAHIEVRTPRIGVCQAGPVCQVPAGAGYEAVHGGARRPRGAAQPGPVRRALPACVFLLRSLLIPYAFPPLVSPRSARSLGIIGSLASCVLSLSLSCVVGGVQACAADSVLSRLRSAIRVTWRRAIIRRLCIKTTRYGFSFARFFFSHPSSVVMQ
jgi:hypothetical protein